MIWVVHNISIYIIYLLYGFPAIYGVFIHIMLLEKDKEINSLKVTKDFIFHVEEEDLITVRL